MQKRKSVIELTCDNFKAYPIWGWYDEDSSLVTPVSEAYLASEEYEDYDPLFISSSLILANKIQVPGFIGFNLEDREAYMIGIFRGNELHIISLVLMTPDEATEELSQWLGHPKDEILPMSYRTPYCLNDQQPIAGTIEFSEPEL